MKHTRSFSWSSIGCIALSALVLVLVVEVAILLQEQQRSLKTATSAVAVASDATFYEGLPLGVRELGDYLMESPSKYEERFMRAYQTGRLPVSARVYEQGAGSHYAQVVGVSLSEEESGPRIEPSCGYYGGACELVLGEGYGSLVSPRLIRDAVGRQGYHPVKFLDENTLLLRGGFGDGPCGSTYYKVMDFSSGTSTRSLAYGSCYWGSTADATFSEGSKELLTFVVRSQIEEQQVESAQRYFIDVKRGEDVLRTLSVVAPNDKTIRDQGVPGLIKPDIEGYFKKPSVLNVEINGKTHSFDIPTN